MEKNYMETLLAQIREKHAKECIRQEVSDHIQDQKQHYIADGMTEEQAEEKAVADMGDPVETGIALDTLHKPKPAWSALAMIAVLCTAGIILQYTIYSSSLSAMGSYFFEKQCLYSVIGFLVLCIVYLVDYTQIAKYSRFLCLGILLLSFLIGNTDTMHGYPQIDLFYCQIRMDLFFYFYLPLYGAVLHSFRRCRPHDLWKLALYTILPICLAFRQVHLSVFINISIILIFMLCTAAFKGWISKSLRLRTLGLILTGFAAFCALIFLNLPVYQRYRIQAWMNPAAFRTGAGYVDFRIRHIISTSHLIGKNTELFKTGSPLDFETDYLLTYLIGKFGFLAAAALIILIVLLGVKLLSVSIHQKNQLGMMMGLGCSLVFIMQSFEYILVNLSLLPVSSLYLPLISYGGNGMLHTCILLGILLSIYRYENIVSEPLPLQYKKDCYTQAELK